MTPKALQEREDEVLESWPRDVSHEPTLKIGEVRAQLSVEFPYLAVSKIRHLETIGLIEPHRTASNQRLFSAADVERLRFVLVEQRDRMIPLSQIGELLRQLDAGEGDGEHPGRMRAVNPGEITMPQPETRLRKDELAALTGASVALVERYVDMGILFVDPRGRLTAQSVGIMRWGMELESQGMDLRQLKAVQTSAHAHAVRIGQALDADRHKKTPVARERVVAQAGEMTAMMAQFYKALLLENVDVELR